MDDGKQPGLSQAARAKRPWVAMVALFLAIIYGILPLDAIPDVIPIIGFGDDALVILGSLLYFYNNFVKRKPEKQDPAQ